MRLIYHKDPENARAQKLIAAAALVDVSLTLEPVSANDKGMNADSAEQDFLDMCDPCGRYPVLDVEDVSETFLFEANAILRYIARMDNTDSFHVYGRTPFEASQVDTWIDFAASELDVHNAPYIKASFQQKKKDQALIRAVPDSALVPLEQSLAALDEVLSIRTFLVGERLSIADIAVAFSMQWVYRCNPKHGESLAQKYKAVYRHYNTIMRQPKIRDVLKKESATIGPLRA